MRRCKLFFDGNNRQKLFRFFRYNGQWVYIHCSEVFPADGLPQVCCHTLIVIVLGNVLTG